MREDDEVNELDDNELEDEASLFAAKNLSRGDEFKILTFMYKLGRRKENQIFI